MDSSPILKLRDLATTDDVDSLIDVGAAVAVGVSGGKDSFGAALATFSYLDKRGHTGPRVLVHAHLGDIEWADSLPLCKELARHLGVELIVVGRKTGGLIERWEERWLANTVRYSEMSMVTLVMPWSSAQWRFCTSDEKTLHINRELLRRFRGMPILNVTGIRRAESVSRAKATIATHDERMSRTNTPVYQWRPILAWSAEDDFAAIAEAGLRPHPGYTEFSMTRISCVFCVLSNQADLRNSASNPAHHPVLRRLVDLEARSTFGFQSAKWLADVAPHVLDAETVDRIAKAKHAAALRLGAEATIPRELLYTKGWPARRVTHAEAALLSDVRHRVADAVGLVLKVSTPAQIMNRYDQLLEAKAVKDAAASKKAARAATRLALKEAA